MQVPIAGDAAVAAEMKNNFSVAVWQHLEIWLMFVEVSSVIPKTLDGVAQFFWRFEFLVEQFAQYLR